MGSSSSGRDKIPPAQRDQALSRDYFECRGCGAVGVQADGSVFLHVHHKCPDPEDRDRHALVNLTTLCRHCHWWLHHRPTRETVPVRITDADHRALLPHDYLILRILHDYGPLSTTEVQERIGLDLAATTVRERLWILAGLDFEVKSRDQPLIAQDAVSGDWGLQEQVAVSERGRIPDDTRTFMRRVQDEFVRRAIERGCDRETIADVFGLVERTTWYKQRRAQVYKFPLDELQHGEIPQQTEHSERTANDQQSLDTVADSVDDAESTADEQTSKLGEPDEVWGASEDKAAATAAPEGTQEESEDIEFQEAIEETIAAMEDGDEMSGQGNAG